MGHKYFLELAYIDTANAVSCQFFLHATKQYAEQTDSKFLGTVLHLSYWNSASWTYCRILGKPDR